MGSTLEEVWLMSSLFYLYSLLSKTSSDSSSKYTIVDSCSRAYGSSSTSSNNSLLQTSNNIASIPLDVTIGVIKDSIWSKDGPRVCGDIK